MGNAYSEGEKCPVDHGKMKVEGAKFPVDHGKSSGTGSPAGDAGAPPPGCPMHASGGAAAAPDASTSSKARGTVYNVYAQPIDPKNQMPATAAQQPSPGQRAELSTSRVQSSIPKGGTESTWLYPSPQMFWNALVRKNKAENVDETDMDIVVKIHNEMNERAWRKLLEWEGLHKG
jgi:cytochrome c heme-lyase